jgi:hypothetical protein
MKKRLLISAIISVLTLLLYPAFKYMAYLERGYNSNAIGGEGLFVFIGAVFVPLMIILHGLENSREKRDNQENDTEVSE